MHHTFPHLGFLEMYNIKEDIFLFPRPHNYFNASFAPTPPSLAMTPQQWENLSEINIAKAEQQKANSVSLRVLVESLLEQTFSDMQKQVEATAAAFKMSVHEIKSAKSQMEDQLAKVGQMGLLHAYGRESDRR